MPFAKLIVNPMAGAGKSAKRWPEIKSLLKQMNYDFDFVMSEFRGHAVDLAKSAAAGGYKTIVSVGGDGTINEIVNGIFQSGNINDVNLGIISTGTGADYIRTIGVPRYYVDACKRLINPKIQKVDVGRVDCFNKDQKISRYFVNFAGMGFDAEIVKATTIKYKALGSFTGYLMGLFTTLITYENNNVSIKIDGTQEHRKICTVILGQGKFGGGGMMTTPNANVADGLFDVLIIGNLDKYDLLKSLPSIYKGTHLSHPKVMVKRAKIVELIPDTIMSIQADGEILGNSPGTFQIIPSILNLAI